MTTPSGATIIRGGPTGTGEGGRIEALGATISALYIVKPGGPVAQVVRAHA